MKIAVSTLAKEITIGDLLLSDQGPMEVSGVFATGHGRVQLGLLSGDMMWLDEDALVPVLREAE